MERSGNEDWPIEIIRSNGHVHDFVNVRHSIVSGAKQWVQIESVTKIRLRTACARQSDMPWPSNALDAKKDAFIP